MLFSAGDEKLCVLCCESLIDRRWVELVFENWDFIASWKRKKRSNVCTMTHSSFGETEKCCCDY